MKCPDALVVASQTHAEVGENRSGDHEEEPRVPVEDVVGRVISPAGRDDEEPEKRIKRLSSLKS